MPFWHAEELLRPMPPSDADLTKRRLAQEMLEIHCQCRLQVSGSSMLPTLWPGDTVRIEKRPQAQLEVGDIVLYERVDRFFLHRVVDLRVAGSETTLITRGDAVPQADALVPIDQVKGVLTGVRRGEEWVALPRRPSPISWFAASLLCRSSFLVRWAVRVKNWTSLATSAAAPEVPTA